MKANHNQIVAALGAPSPDVRLYLLHGPDESGAADLGSRLARALGPEVERIDLEGATLKADPARLADEAASLSLFGGVRFIRVSNMGEESADAVAGLLDAAQAGNPVLAIAPGVKASGRLVKLAVGSPRAMAHACYIPDGANADRLVAAIARDHGLRTTGDTARRLASASGGDRAIVTREIEKLALYLDAGVDRPSEIDDAALDAIGADLGEAEMGRAVDAAIDGRTGDIGPELKRLDEAGISPIPVLRALVRRLMTLAELAADVAAGGSIADVVDRHRVFFREKASTERALRHWSPMRLSQAIDGVRQAERALMASASAGPVVAEHAMLGVARLGSRRK